MNHSKLIDELLNELSYRVGIVDLKNKNHQSIISEILSEWGEYDVKKIIMEFLTNEAPDDTKGDDKDYSHLGAGIYVRKGDEDKDSAQKYKKDDSGSLKAISDAEYQKTKADQGEEGEQAAADTPQNQQGGSGGEQTEEPEKGTSLKQGGYDKKVEKEDEIRKKLDNASKGTSTETSNSVFNKKDETILNRVKQQIEKNSIVLSDSDKKMASDVYSFTEKLFDESVSDDKKREIAEDLKNKFKITTNAGNTKYYINALGKNRKLFGNGTKSTERLVSQIKKYTQLEEVDYSGIKKKLTAAAKPDLGKEFEVKPDRDSNVKTMFESSPILSKIKKSQHGIFAPIGEDGKIIFPSNKNSKEYLKQSFENPALTKTIELTRGYVSDGLLTKEYLDALENHKKRLNGILDNYEIPSDQAAKAIGESYNDLMIGLNNADSEAASAVMKQLAENRLYETNLALGEEVYLPSNGSFPGGDIIHIGSNKLDGKLEKVALVSCKFGKKGRTYGCPANMKAVTQLHPDESKRNIFGQYVGESGFTMMIDDSLIEGTTENDTQEKTTKLLKDSLLNQGLSEIFNEGELEEVSKICSDYFYKLKNTRIKLKSELADVKASVFWGEFQKELSTFKKEYQTKIQKIVDVDKLKDIFGENNVPNFKTRLTPDVLLSGILLTENIRTSGGYGLEHNKQYYTDAGEPMYKTEAGNDNPDDYSLTIRNERTAGRNGGGIQLSYTGDGKRPTGELQE